MEAEREKNHIRSMAWAVYQVLGTFYGIHGPARIMNWLHDVAAGEDREVSELFPITAEERAKYEWHGGPLESAAREIAPVYSEFLVAVEALLDWMNGNDLSADHQAECPEDFKRLSEMLPKVKAVLERHSAAQPSSESQDPGSGQ